VIVRRAARGDVAAVAALEEDLFGVDAWSAAAVEQELLGPRRTALVACPDEGGSPVGYAVVLAGPDVIDVQRIGVSAAYRRSGVGRRLLAEALAAAPPADRVVLEVSAANEGGLAFYHAEGFGEVGRRPAYYRDRTDALVLEAARRRWGTREGDR
jgi:ribosomal-protein-alanine N-acetyltransferase